MQFIITGGHTGIGLELTKMLLSGGHLLGLIVRDESRIAALIEDVGEDANIEFFFADLSIQADVVKVANEISQTWHKIDGLFNNAGVLLDQMYLSEQGNEMHFEVNTLAPYLLTELLVAKLLASPYPFVVNTVTGGLQNRSIISPKELQRPSKFVKLFGSYMDSKLALLGVMNALASSLGGIRFISVDPGALKTKMSTNNDAMPRIMQLISRLFFRPPQSGAKKIFDGAFSAKYVQKTGVYVSGGKIKDVKLKLSESDFEGIITNIDRQYLKEIPVAGAAYANASK